MCLLMVVVIIVGSWELPRCCTELTKVFVFLGSNEVKAIIIAAAVAAVAAAVHLWWVAVATVTTIPAAAVVPVVVQT